MPKRPTAPARLDLVCPGCGARATFTGRTPALTIARATATGWTPSQDPTYVPGAIVAACPRCGRARDGRRSVAMLDGR